MEYIRVTKENLESEHICCAIANNKDIRVAFFKDGEYVTNEQMNDKRFLKRVNG